MSRRTRGRDVHGIFLLDKPAGLSSNQALQRARRLLDARKAGHTGSLDPFATGMLPLCFGEATKTAGFMLDADKSYQATARLGEATDTGDLDGSVTQSLPVPDLTEADIGAAMAGFVGEIEQVPPMYSALKQGGRPLYERARRGEQVERQPRRVRILSLRLLEWAPPLLTFDVRCSKGTYIRTLAEDIGRSLACCAHLVALRRLQVGPFRSEQMHSLEALERSAQEGSADALLLPVDAGLSGWPMLALDAGQAERFAHGNPLPVAGSGPGSVRVYGSADRLLGLGEVSAAGELRPSRVFNLPEPAGGPRAGSQ